MVITESSDNKIRKSLCLPHRTGESLRPQILSDLVVWQRPNELHGRNPSRRKGARSRPVVSLSALTVAHRSSTFGLNASALGFQGEAHLNSGVSRTTLIKSLLRRRKIVKISPVNYNIAVKPTQ
ncbi:hypothetical protein FOZ62_030110 [Perkinsus olseni]|uniref:Uncharacterized protein n=1 Tax=Perkinsus olseni TaxID=32597 RepID=A0A7J6SPU4_PEROL|nr:hypothetical protein FOZ62_030110 [Perkinsus olseni]